MINARLLQDPIFLFKITMSTKTVENLGSCFQKGSPALVQAFPYPVGTRTEYFKDSFNTLQALHTTACLT
jgi:hypothetical protein